MSVSILALDVGACSMKPTVPPWSHGGCGPSDGPIDGLGNATAAPVRLCVASAQQEWQRQCGPGVQQHSPLTS